MSELNEILGQVTEEVLEQMFFSGVAGEPEMPPPGERLCATVTFSGSSHGELGVSLPPSTAATLAAAFLGSDDEAVDSQIRAVAGEIANVVCGVVLARMNPDGQFSISSPAVMIGDDTEAVGSRAVRRHFEIIEGDLSVGLTVH